MSERHTPKTKYKDSQKGTTRSIKRPHRLQKIPRYFLLREYEAIQRKIDNYGGDNNARMTIIVSVLAAALFTSNNSYGVWPSIVGIMVIFVFLLTESKNDLHIEKLKQRAYVLERAIERDCKVKSFPYIARSVMGKPQINIISVASNCAKMRFGIYYFFIAILFVRIVTY